jgi:hypothetical protein
LYCNHRPLLLVGDNPFHGISHLSQERVRDRGNNITIAENASDIVASCLSNGANGFMFSVSDTTLSILSLLRNKTTSPLHLYPLVPYAYEYVRLATRAGGISGLSKQLASEIVQSGNLKVALLGFKGVLRKDLENIFKAYLSYEISRISSSVGKKGIICSLFLHEIITDMAMALDSSWVFKTYVDYLEKLSITPGFETRNYPFLVKKLKSWNINLDQLMIAAPFNKVGFYMNPAREACEEILGNTSESNVIAMSILAAGYLTLPEAVDYLHSLPNLKGVVVGVSNKKQAYQTFKFLNERL